MLPPWIIDWFKKKPQPQPEEQPQLDLPFLEESPEPSKKDIDPDGPFML